MRRFPPWGGRECHSSYGRGIEEAETTGLDGVGSVVKTTDVTQGSGETEGICGVESGYEGSWRRGCDAAGAGFAVGRRAKLLKREALETLVEPWNCIGVFESLVLSACGSQKIDSGVLFMVKIVVGKVDGC